VEYSRSFFPVLFIVFVLRSFLVEPFQIPSSSMVPTLLVGDYILVNKFTYGIRLPVVRTKVFEMNEPRRGDVMVFFPPHLNDTYFIKRVVGLPGDRIRYIDKKLYINGEEVSQELLAQLPPSRPRYRLKAEQLGESPHEVQNDMLRRNDDFSLTVKPGHYFMMGDNRDNSSDSRVWGQVPERDIVGKAFAIWMHWDSFFSMPSFQRVGSIQ
jgi:signal peptidase I